MPAGTRRLNPAFIVLSGLVLLIIAATLYFVLPRPHRTRTTALQPGASGTVNTLIIGKDARAVGPTSNEGGQRNKREDQSHSDIVIVCHINFSIPAVNLVAIPRDMLVQVPGITTAASPTDFTHMEKITHTYAIGGEKLLRRTVESFLGIRIQRSIAFDFDSFRMAFDLLRPFVGILRIGNVSLTDRNQALQFARKRYGLLYDDADRCRNAVSLIRAVATRTWWLAGTRLGDALVKRLLEIVGEDTNLTADEIDQIAAGLRNAAFSPGIIRTAVLVGDGAEVTLAHYNQTLSCYLPAYREIEKQVEHFLLDKSEVMALDFMSQQPFRVPDYMEGNYVVPVDSGPKLPFDTTGLDSHSTSTMLLELQQIQAEQDSPPADPTK